MSGAADERAKTQDTLFLTSPQDLEQLSFESTSFCESSSTFALSLTGDPAQILETPMTRFLTSLLLGLSFCFQIDGIFRLHQNMGCTLFPFRSRVQNTMQEDFLSRFLSRRHFRLHIISCTKHKRLIFFFLLHKRIMKTAAFTYPY